MLKQLILLVCDVGTKGDEGGTQVIKDHICYAMVSAGSRRWLQSGLGEAHPPLEAVCNQSALNGPGI